MFIQEGVLVCNRSSTVYRVSLTGEILSRYVCSDDSAQILSLAVSSLGKFVYGLSSSVVFAWNYETGVEEAKLPLPTNDALRIAVHPHLNVIVVLSMDEKALLFRAPERE